MTENLPALAEVLSKKPEDMSNSEFAVLVFEGMMQGWMPFETYKLHFPTEVRSRVEYRIEKGFWKDRVHYHKPVRGQIWINLPAVRRWASGQE